MVLENRSVKHPKPVKAAADECLPRSKKSQQKARAISLFSGAGGLDIGLESAGWEILAQIEMDDDCVETLRNEAGQRRPRPLVVHSKIEDVDPTVLRRNLGLRKGELTLLAGGPPCQPFTTSGLRQAINDRRACSLFPAYFHIVDEFRPQLLLIENVDGMLSAALRHRPLLQRSVGFSPLEADEQKGSFLRWFLDELSGRGYSMSWGVAEAADYGVPQMRQRSIVIGVLDGGPCYLPPPQYGYDGLPRYRDLRWALRDLLEIGAVQPLSKRKRDVYSLIPPGGNWRTLPTAMRKETMGAAFSAEGGKSGWWRRLSWKTPAPTILGMPDHSSTALVHPQEVRCLSVNECAAIQTFPSSTRFAGTSRSQYQQIGNAVPVLLGRALGEHLKCFLSGEPQPKPPEPQWRKCSANRRIGTHGWIRVRGGEKEYHFNVPMRDDHVWSKIKPAEVCG